MIELLFVLSLSAAPEARICKIDRVKSPASEAQIPRIKCIASTKPQTPETPVLARTR